MNSVLMAPGETELTFYIRNTSREPSKPACFRSADLWYKSSEVDKVVILRFYILVYPVLVKNVATDCSALKGAVGRWSFLTQVLREETKSRLFSLPQFQNTVRNGGLEL